MCICQQTKECRARQFLLSVAGCFGFCFFRSREYLGPAMEFLGAVSNPGNPDITLFCIFYGTILCVKCCDNSSTSSRYVCECGGVICRCFVLRFPREACAANLSDGEPCMQDSTIPRGEYLHRRVRVPMLQAKRLLNGVWKGICRRERPGGTSAWRLECNVRSRR